MKHENVGAVIVLYNPNLDCLKLSLINLQLQVCNIILVDNSIDNINTLEFLNEFDSNLINYIPLNKNTGVAAAQNIGISFFIKKKMDFCLIMDQDSIISDNMVTQLLGDFLFLKSKNINLAIIGPTPINKETKKEYSPRIRKNKAFFNEKNHLIKVSELISSGSLINIKNLKDIGYMDEKLFIDGVDHEWCWRAINKGYSCAMSKKAILYHMLGEGDKKIFGIQIAITSSFRVYYQYRNYFYLLKKSYVPIYWKFNNAIKYFIKFFYYPIFVSPRKLYMKNIIKGIYHGIKY